MGFLSGRLTFTRYRVSGVSPLPFGDDLLEQARQHLLGRHTSAEPEDGIVAGWAAGDHVLDLNMSAFERYFCESGLTDDDLAERFQAARDLDRRVSTDGHDAVPRREYDWRGGKRAERP